MALARIVASAVVAAGLSGAGADAQPAGRAGAILTVNDADAIGTPGDARLSLDEAVRLASGALTVDRLSKGERAQVKGIPGARSRDTILLARGATITVAAGKEVTRLTGNDGDTLDGNGATLIAGRGHKGIGITLSSSDFTLRNLRLRDFRNGVEVEFGGRTLRNISLERLDMNCQLGIGATSSNGSLRGVTVSDGVFNGVGVKGLTSLVYIRAAATPADTTVDDVLLEDVRFVRNRLTGAGLGLYLTGSLGTGRTTNAVTRNVVVNDNVFAGQDDAALNFVGALPAGGGQHDRVGLENVVSTGNRVEAANWGYYMGNELFGAWKGMKPGTMTAGFLRNIVVEGNVVTRNALGSVGHCIELENTADFRGDVSTGNVIEKIRIVDNDISGCVEMRDERHALQALGAGIVVNAGRASIGSDNAGGTVRDNIARDIEIARNRISKSTRGIVLTGGYNRYAGTQPQVSTATGNRLTAVRIEDNRIDRADTAIRLAAGDGPAGAIVTGNAIGDVRIAGNRITGARVACEAIANAGSATGNTLEAACPPAN